MARRESEPAAVVSQRLAEEQSASLRRSGTVGTPRSRPNRLPFISDLLRHRPHGLDSDALTSTTSPMVDTTSPVIHRWEAIKKDSIRYGELLKTSFNHGSDKPHGFPNKRLFSLTEEAIEYYHVFFGQIRTDGRSFPLTSIEAIQREVPGNSSAFRLVFKKFTMELEASSAEEADAWERDITEYWKQWQEIETLKKDSSVEEGDDEERGGFLSLKSTQQSPMKVKYSQQASYDVSRELKTIPEEGTSAGSSLSKKRVSRRPRSLSAGSKLFSAQPSVEEGMDRKCRKTIRRQLHLAPKLEKHAAVVKATEEEEKDHQKLHNDYAMIKYPRRHWWAIPNEKIFKIDSDNLQIMWRRHFASNLSLKSNLPLDSILEVRLGQESSGFDRFPYDEMDKQSFSLIYEGMRGKYAHLESLDLICDHQDHFDEWVKGLDTLQIGPVTNMFPRRYENTDPVLLWLKRFWTCKHVDHELEEKTAFKLIQKLNPYLTENYCKKLVQEAHLNQREATVIRGNTLRWDGFILLFNLLCSETGRLYEVFREYAVTHKRLGMTREEFRQFLMNECHWTPDQCSHRKLKELMTFHDFHHRAFKKYTSGKKAEKMKLSANLLSYAGFLSFLRSKHNAAVNPVHNTVYQEMDHPLSHYFINSSHNTYLEADQIKGKSTLDAYVRALLHGCRCIEIDCWDNTIGKEPLVYHGYTFTTKLPLRDILHTLKHYAFQMSHYPLIISIENHCSSEQQATMARMFIEELVDGKRSMLATDNLVEGELCWRRRLPSPEELQGKILLKGSFKTPEQQAKMHKVVSKANTRSLMPFPESATDLTAGTDNAPDTNGRERVSIVRSRGSTRKDAEEFRRRVQSGEIYSFAEDDQEVSYTETAPDLQQLIIYCRSTRLKPWNWKKQKKTTICQMFSFGENTAESLCKKNSLEMLACTERQLVRTYPKGTRIESSNYSPVMFWNHGIHMAALNYQYPDIFMHLNQGKFRQNGGCGYILKPKVMRTTYSQRPEKQFDPNMTMPHPDVPTCELEISLLSGQNLSPLGKGNVYISVTIATYGIPADCAVMVPKAEASLPFWPQWPKNLHTLQRRILMPELCLVYFRADLVHRSLGTDQLTGQNCIPLSSLQPGIKFIQLRKPGGALVPESGLFVRIKKVEDVISAPQEPHVKQQQSPKKLQPTIDPTQSIFPSQFAPEARHQQSDKRDYRSRPKLQRQSMREESVNPFDFSAALTAANEKTNGKLKSNVSFETSEVRLEADIHESPSPVSSPTSDSPNHHAVPSGSGHVTLLVIPTSRDANSGNGHVINNATAEQSVQDVSETATQATYTLEMTTALASKEES